MAELFFLLLLIAGVLLLVGILGLVWELVELVFTVLFWPVKVVAGVVLLPILFVFKVLAATVIGLALVPLGLVALAIALVGGAFVVAVPLLPLLLIALVLWAASRRPEPRALPAPR